MLKSYYMIYEEGNGWLRTKNGRYYKRIKTLKKAYRLSRNMPIGSIIEKTFTKNGLPHKQDFVTTTTLRA